MTIVPDKLRLVGRALVLGLGVIFFGWLFFGDTDAEFRSSDGKWADGEVQFKGRDFRVVAWDFQDYKLGCHAATATLLRATPQRWFNVFAWPSYLRDRKWRVPYSDAHPELEPTGFPVAQADCSGPVDLKSVDRNAQAYLSQL
ncbi:MAG TPA: hypothetical protein VHL34_18870 [Rhizomicrobium sp.]|nr:hypothetical protein [Rhizomicrobium sp.]